MGRSGLSTVLKSLGLLIFTLLALVFMIGGDFSPVEQLSGDDSVLHFGGDKTTQFIVATAGVLIAMVAIGVGLGVSFFRLTREVTGAKQQENIPTNPLEYRSYGHPMAAALAVGFALVLLGIYFVVGLMPTQASTQAVLSDRIFGIAFVVVAALFGLVMGLFVHSLLYFRADPDDMTDGKHFHTNIPLELTWTIVPIIFVLGLGIYTVTQYNDLVEEKEGEVPIAVHGVQWEWSFTYPTELFFDDAEYADLDERQRKDIEDAGGVNSAELYLLIDQPIRLDLGSTDVIHSFWIPEMRVKQDVVPGVDTVMRLTPNLVGDYMIRCAELCGLSHWEMTTPVHVVDQSGFDEWIAQTKSAFGDPRIAGRNIAEQQGCLVCHSTTGASGTGPTWKDLIGNEREFEDGGSTTANFDYVQESIQNPSVHVVRGFTSVAMPNRFGGLSELSIEQIYTYMCTISATAPADETCAAIFDAIAQSEAEAAAGESTDTATDDATDTSDQTTDSTDGSTTDDTSSDDSGQTSDDSNDSTDEAPQDNVEILG